MIGFIFLCILYILQIRCHQKSRRMSLSLEVIISRTSISRKSTAWWKYPRIPSKRVKLKLSIIPTGNKFIISKERKSRNTSQKVFTQFILSWKKHYSTLKKSSVSQKGKVEKEDIRQAFVAAVEKTERCTPNNLESVADIIRVRRTAEKQANLSNQKRREADTKKQWQ